MHTKDSTNISSAASVSAVQEELEALRVENESLRFALEQTQEKLQRLMVARCVGESGNAAVGTAVDDPVRQVQASKQERGVAFAQMRRLLLKDQNFLPKTLLPFLDIGDLGRYGWTSEPLCAVTVCYRRSCNVYLLVPSPMPRILVVPLKNSY